MDEHVGADDVTQADARSGFEQVFGISEEQLRASGVDRQEYVRQTLDEWREDPALRAEHLPGYPESAILRSEWVRGLTRGWVSIFVGFVALLIFALTQHDHVVHLIAGGVAIVAMVAVIVVIGRTTPARRRYVRACRQEGIDRNDWQR